MSVERGWRRELEGYANRLVSLTAKRTFGRNELILGLREVGGWKSTVNRREKTGVPSHR
jgi:hypothetical protein